MGAPGSQWLSDRVSTFSFADLWTACSSAPEAPSRYDDASAVEPSSWGSIKAALRVRP